MSPLFRLTMKTGPTPNALYDLTNSDMIIGRDTSNNIVINDTEVSRKHARLTPQAGSYLLQDLGSTNGTFIGGKRLMSPHLLHPGETITFGQNITLIFEAVETDLNATLQTAVSSAPYAPATMVEAARPIQAAPPMQSYQAPQVVYAAPVQAQPVPPPPIYPSTPHAVPVEVPPTQAKSSPFNTRLVLGGCGCLLLVGCVALGALLLWIDAGGADRWCQFFGFILPACP